MSWVMEQVENLDQKQAFSEAKEIIVAVIPFSN